METEVRLAALRGADYPGMETMRWAADEIERLQAGLQAISDYCGTDYYLGDAGEMARSVLDGKDARAWL